MDFVPWANFLVAAKIHMNISPQEFWQLTFGEFWPMWEAIFVDPVEAKRKKHVSRNDLKDMERAFASGNFRRTGR